MARSSHKGKMTCVDAQVRLAFLKKEVDELLSTFQELCEPSRRSDKSARRGTKHKRRTYRARLRP